MCHSTRTYESISSLELTLNICCTGFICDSRLLTDHKRDEKSIITLLTWCPLAFKKHKGETKSKLSVVIDSRLKVVKQATANRTTFVETDLKKNASF